MKHLFALAVVAVLLAGCGGGGNDSAAGSGNKLAPPSQPTPTGVATITGKITFDYVPVTVASGTAKLDYTSSSRRPARSIAIVLVDSTTGAELGTAKTNSSGDYSLITPVGKSVFVRAYARLLPVNTSTTAPVSVLDNTNADAQWALDGAAFSAVDATALTKNLNAGSGWTGISYNDSQRIAATFAMLDTIYTAMQKIVAVDSSANFPKLDMHWSPNNIAATGSIALGQIGTSFFTSTKSAGVVTARDLYILGKANNDTDEYDQHVIAHEFGHYLQSAFSRDDSVGGSHGGANDRLDMRVAFSEGWGNGWAAYALDNKLYADTSGPSQSNGFSFDVSAGEAINPGWFKEKSVQKVIWDLSTGSVGFSSVWTAMKTGVATNPALTSAHSFANALRVNLPSSGVALNAIFGGQKITVPSDAYGTGETNFGSPSISQINPIYLAYGALGSAINACVTNAADAGGAGNKAGQYRYLKLTLPAGPHTVTVVRDPLTAAAAIGTDPDFKLYNSAGAFLTSESNTPNFESATTAVLTSDIYVLSITDYKFKTLATLRTVCFDVTVN